MEEPRGEESGGGVSGGKASRCLPWCVAAVLSVLVVSVYWGVGDHGFVNIDDDLYVYENPAVLRGLSLDGVSWAFRSTHAFNWHPLTWLSHMLDVELFGPSPGWHHRVNVLYHLLNTVLLFGVLWRMTGGLWPSAFAAALFGVHPLHVESVAWVAERKDVLSTLFWLLATGAYARYARRPGTARYLLVMGLFALGLLCKPMLVTLPLALLLLDYWPLGRMAPPGGAAAVPGRVHWPAVPALVREKVPLLALSAASCAVTYVAQARGGTVGQWEHYPLAARAVNAFGAYAAYLGKAVWPSSLAVYYPHPASVGAGVPAWAAAGWVLLFCGLFAAALGASRRRPYLAVGWLWYVGTLVPVIGLVQVGGQSHADRYTYVPLIGIFVAVAWGVPSLLAGWRQRRVALGALAGASLLALSAAAWAQAGYWRDSVALFTRAAAVTDGNWLALYNLGHACNRLGRHPEAVDHFREALRIKPDYANGWNNLGVSYIGLGRHGDAIGCFREALRLRPDLAEAWNNLGVCHGAFGRFSEAAGCFREALRLRPDYPDAQRNLLAANSRLGSPGNGGGPPPR